MTNETTHHKRFQIDRIALFSDAVFAIAITLLIIEIKVPHVSRAATDAEMWEKVEELIPELIGFVMSFFVIGLYWLVHHRMFGYIINYNQKLLVTNLVFLLSIVLMPFSSAFFSDYFATATKIPLAFYVANICFSGLMSYRLWKVISKPGNHLSEGLENPITVRYFLIRSLLVPGTFVLIFLLSFVFGAYAYYFSLLPLFVTRFITAYYRKKHPEIFARFA